MLRDFAALLIVGMKSLEFIFFTFLLTFLPLSAMSSVSVCGKAQNTEFSESAISSRIDELIFEQIRIAQKDYGTRSEFQMALEYFNTETKKLSESFPSFQEKYMQRYFEIRDKIIQKQSIKKKRQAKESEVKKEIIDEARIPVPKKIAEIFLPDLVVSANFSYDGKFVITGSMDKMVRIIEVGSGRIIRSISHQEVPNSVNFSPDGKFIVTSANDKIIRVIDISSGQTIHKIPYTGVVYAVKFSLEGKIIATQSENRMAQLVNMDSKQLLRQIKHGTGSQSLDFLESTFRNFNFSLDEVLLAATNVGSTALIIELGTGEVLQRIPHTGTVYWANFSPDGKLLITGAADKLVRIIEVGTGKVLHKILQESGEITSVNFSHDGRLFVIGSRGRVEIFKLNQTIDD